MTTLSVSFEVCSGSYYIVLRRCWSFCSSVSAKKWNSTVKALSQQCWTQEATVAADSSPQWVGSAVCLWHPGGWGPAVATQHVYAPACPEHWAADGGSRSPNLLFRPAPLWSQHKARPAGRDLPPLHPAWRQQQTNITKYIIASLNNLIWFVNDSILRSVVSEKQTTSMNAVLIRADNAEFTFTLHFQPYNLMDYIF